MSTTIQTHKTPRPHHVIHARDFQLNLGSRTHIMAIINVTPDSFSGDGCLNRDTDVISKAVRKARHFIKEGADIIDIGGESSRPTSKRISLTEEIQRVIPTVKALAKQNQVPISVDTYKSSVAQHALDAGASIINNIKGIKSEKKLLTMVRDYDAAIVLMHMKGTPRTMQKNISYKDLITEIFDSLRNSIENCLEIGIKLDKIIIDPGIGFGKTVDHNLEIMDRLADFQDLNQPILIGTSRKSFIGKVLKQDTKHRLWGTAASVSTGILKGAHIIRVHDVKEMSQVSRMTDAILNRAFN